MSVDPAMLERAKLTQEGMAQFETLHGPTKFEEEARIVCAVCDTDWPCNRMATMLIVQALAMLQSMIPSGNMGALLSRFSGNAR